MPESTPLERRATLQSLLEMGARLLPLRPSSKTPAVPKDFDWLREPIPPEEVLDAALVGLVPASLGLLALDLDYPDRIGNTQFLPDGTGVLTVRSKSEGKFHSYMRYEAIPDFAGNWYWDGQHVGEIRCDRGYIALYWDTPEQLLDFVKSEPVPVPADVIAGLKKKPQESKTKSGRTIPGLTIDHLREAAAHYPAPTCYEERLLLLLSLKDAVGKYSEDDLFAIFESICDRGEGYAQANNRGRAWWDKVKPSGSRSLGSYLNECKLRGWKAPASRKRKSAPNVDSVGEPEAQDDGKLHIRGGESIWDLANDFARRYAARYAYDEAGKTYRRLTDDQTHWEAVAFDFTAFETWMTWYREQVQTACEERVAEINRTMEGDEAKDTLKSVMGVLRLTHAAQWASGATLKGLQGTCRRWWRGRKFGNVPAHLQPVRNGIIDMRKRTLAPHKPWEGPGWTWCHPFEVTLAEVAGIERPPLWDELLDMVDVWLEDDQRDFLRGTLREALAGDIIRTFLVLEGVPGSGKSSLFASLQIPGIYADLEQKDVELARFRPTHQGSIKRAIQTGARIWCYPAELEGVRLDAAFLKRITGYDTVSARGSGDAHGEEVEAKVSVLPVLVINNVENLRLEVDDALLERQKTVSFRRPIPASQAERRAFGRRFRVLLDDPEWHRTVFVWILHGPEHAEPPASIQQATLEAAVMQDPVLAWLRSQEGKHRTLGAKAGQLLTDLQGTESMPGFARRITATALGRKLGTAKWKRDRRGGIGAIWFPPERDEMGNLL